MFGQGATWPDLSRSKWECGRGPDNEKSLLSVQLEGDVVLVPIDAAWHLKVLRRR